MAKDTRHEIVITSFGNRPHLRTLVDRLRRLTDVPISIIGENDYTTDWKGHSRWGVRNSNQAKAKAVLDKKNKDKILLLLDDDMIPVSDRFVEGFKLAEVYDVCLPVNPRCHAGLNLEVGADVREAEREVYLKMIPYTMTGVNMGVAFVACDRITSRELFSMYLTLCMAPMRGTSAMDVAIWLTGRKPYYLSPMWCVCGSDANRRTTTSREVLVEPIFLHGGHKAVVDWFNTDEIFERYR